MAGAWLITDMFLNISTLTLVKLIGVELPASQLVFIRAITGLVLILPWVIRERAAFSKILHPALHIIRILLSVTALTASYFAVARLPLALFTAINFTRPLLLMIMAAWILKESISRSRWLLAIIGLSGVGIALNPGSIQWSWGIPALLLTIFSSTLATIATRYLKGTPAVVMMLLYTAGLSLLTLPMVLFNWQPVPKELIWPLLFIGVFAQAGQYCFIKAHWLGEASILGPLGYVSLLLSITAGYLVFAEVPDASMMVGSAIILLATLALSFTKNNRH
ncbi:Riboflavin transporter [Granulosicoccus antarcticus IMCC3135]|uniref:Riboflavin transporter n=1 Tax=Granulosicoccus antarcticus IMCC3135 TaxID=1192854 RepID=A0A2Z2P6K9_9GAMM|nr:Riboflavin transporter [Granulosicoccus antarcticus IMCC3135]